MGHRIFFPVAIQLRDLGDKVCSKITFLFRVRSG